MSNLSTTSPLPGTIVVSCGTIEYVVFISHIGHIENQTGNTQYKSRLHVDGNVIYCHQSVQEICDMIRTEKMYHG